MKIAEDSDVVFLPTGASRDDLRPTLALARKLAKHGAEGRLVMVLSKVGRSEPPVAEARSRPSRRPGSNCCPSNGRSATAFKATSIPAAPDARRAIPILREAAERMEAALFARVERARPR